MAKAVVLNDVVVDLSNWNMRDLSGFTKGVAENNFEEIAPIAAKAITSWPYDKDVADPETWASLPLPAVAHILNTVRKAVELVFAEGN